MDVSVVPEWQEDDDDEGEICDTSLSAYYGTASGVNHDTADFSYSTADFPSSAEDYPYSAAEVVTAVKAADLAEFFCHNCSLYSFREKSDGNDTLCYACESSLDPRQESVICDICNSHKPREGECLHCASLVKLQTRLAVRFRDEDACVRCGGQHAKAGEQASHVCDDCASKEYHCRHCERHIAMRSVKGHKLRQCIYCSKHFCTTYKTGARAKTCSGSVCMEIWRTQTWFCTNCINVVTGQGPPSRDGLCASCKSLCGMCKQSPKSGLHPYCESCRVIKDGV